MYHTAPVKKNRVFKMKPVPFFVQCVLTVSLAMGMAAVHAKEWYLQCNACHPLQTEDPATIDAVEQFIYLQPAIQVGDVIDVYKNESPPSGNTLTLEHWYGVVTIPANRIASINDITSYGTMGDVLDNAPPSGGPGGDPLLQFQVDCGESLCSFPTNPPFPVTGWLAPAVN